MISIKTEKIKLSNTPAAVSLAEVFKRAKSALQHEGKVPIRMIVLNRNRNQCDLLVSFIYGKTKK